MYFSYKNNAFERVITKYFSILRKINPKFLRWKSSSKKEYKLYNISDFLNYDLIKYKDAFKDDSNENVEKIVIEENTTLNDSSNNIFAELFEKVKNQNSIQK
jgi:hypothetical protein